MKFFCLFRAAIRSAREVNCGSSTSAMVLCYLLPATGEIGLSQIIGMIRSSGPRQMITECMWRVDGDASYHQILESNNNHNIISVHHLKNINYDSEELKSRLLVSESKELSPRKQNFEAGFVAVIDCGAVLMGRWPIATSLVQR